MGLYYPSSPWSHPLMTCPEPRVKVSGSPRGMLESNSVPSSYRVPWKKNLNYIHFKLIIIMWDTNRVVHLKRVPPPGLHLAVLRPLLNPDLELSHRLLLWRGWKTTFSLLLTISTRVLGERGARRKTFQIFMGPGSFPIPEGNKEERLEKRIYWRL